jgi:nucleoside-diphosphate-sugar epimerase
MSTQLKIFITGATGYVGGGVLARLLRHPKAGSFLITALVRSVDKGDKLKTLGVEYVLGSYTDEDLSFLTNAAADADVVIAMVDSDKPLAAQAILEGIKIKYQKSGKAPILIHTSGTALIADDARGLTTQHTAYSDLDVEKLNALPESVLHRDTDIPIIEADKAGFVKAYLITPGAIFGYPSGPLVDLGIQNRHSMPWALLIRPSIERKQGAYFGKGVNTWSAVSIDDTVDLYLILFDIVRQNPEAIGHGPEGYYFAENSEFSAIEVAQTISEALFELGVASSKEPSACSQEELDKFGPFWLIFAANCYARADRSRALGWKPTGTKDDFLAHIKAEVKELLSELTLLKVRSPPGLK